MATELIAGRFRLLEAAHVEGVVHRDLKPRKVMVTRGGFVKVLDFGMGRIVGDSIGTKLSSTGVTVGTGENHTSALTPPPGHGPRHEGTVE